MILTIRVIPRSGRCEYRFDKNGTLKVYLKSVPEHGAANHELIAAFAQWLDVPKKHISIVSGATTRLKRIKIETTQTKEQILKRLGIIWTEQLTLFS